MNRSTYLLAVTLAGSALLAACGGGGDSTEPVPVSAVPASANASIAGMAAWINSESDESDATEPLDVMAFNPPMADDVEPLGLAI